MRHLFLLTIKNKKQQMSDYMKAYSARLQRNQDDLIALIHAVKEKDNTIEAYIHNDSDRLINNVVFIKDETINSIWFLEVPYGWSGCGYDGHNRHAGLENCAMPFTADDVINNFKPIKGSPKSQVENFKAKADYLKWYSFYKKHTNDKTDN